MKRWGLALACLLVTSSARADDVGGKPQQRVVTKMPVLQRFVEAEVPPAAKESAEVILTIEIAATGQVTAVSVARSAGPDYDAAAVAAAKQFVFSPAEVDGKAAPAKITYRYAFVVKIVEHVQSTPIVLPPPPLPVVEAQDVEVRGVIRERREAFDMRVRAEQASKVAGTQGDVLKVVQNLPGVSRPPVASGQIVVWGSSPRETRTYVDGVEIPALYHGSGLRGTIGSDLVASIDLVPGAFGAEHGRGLGGLVRVETRALPRGSHGYASADTLDGSALVSTELREGIRVAVGARQSWLDRVLPVFTSKDIGDFFPIPRYRDLQVKATFDLRPRESIDAVFLASGDDLARTVPSPDPAATKSEATSSSFLRAYARYTNVTEAGDTVIVTPFVGHDASDDVQRFGGNPARLSVSSDVWGLRASMKSRIAPPIAITGGMDALGTSSSVVREGSPTLPPREGDISVFGQPPGDAYDADDFGVNVVDLGPHVYADVRVGPVVVTPGVRADAYLIEGSRRLPRFGLTPPGGFSRLETAIAPRASARWQVAPRLAFTAAWGQYHQPPAPEELSPVFGTPDLTLSRATHATLGESLRITDTLTAEVVGFHKSLKDLVVRTRLSDPIVARALTQNGEGRSYGVQLLLRQEAWRGFFGWVSYAITRSERRNEGDLEYRLFDFDQPHVLSVVASQAVGRWSFGARFRYASGNPRTPVVGSYYDARDDRYEPVFGIQNTTRIPSFWQLDVRVDRSFPLGSRATLLVYADVQNVTNHANAEELAYSPDFSRRGTITGLPTIAVIGARLEL